MDLHILDTSNYLYAGYNHGVGADGYRNFFPSGLDRPPSWCSRIERGVRQVDGMWMANSIPVSGILFLLSEISKMAVDGIVIMPVFDKTPTIKRTMYEEVFGNPYGYKGTREVDKRTWIDIKFMKMFGEAICNKIGFPVQSAEGYESDDLIYTLVEMYKDDFRHVFVHTRDSDLSFLVSDNVSIEPVGKTGKVITMDNYEYTVRNGCLTQYNTIHLNKLIKGDRSDNIDGIGNWWAECINKFLTKENQRKLGDLNECRRILREAVKENPTYVNASRVLSTFNLIVPLVVPQEMINVYESDVDWNMLDRYYLGNFDEHADRWGCEALTEEYIETYYEMEVAT